MMSKTKHLPKPWSGRANGQRPITFIARSRSTRYRMVDAGFEAVMQFYTSEDSTRRQVDALIAPLYHVF